MFRIKIEIIFMQKYVWEILHGHDFIAVLTSLEKLHLWLHSRTKSAFLFYKAAFYCVRTAEKTLKELPKQEVSCEREMLWLISVATGVDDVNGHSGLFSFSNKHKIHKYMFGD